MLHDRSLMAFIATTQPELSLRFYRDTLGLTLLGDEEHAIVFDANGIMLRIQKAPHHKPAPHTALGWNVPDINQSVKRLSELGIRFERFPHFDQDALGVWRTPDGTRVAWFKDPDGNLLSLTQFPESA